MKRSTILASAAALSVVFAGSWLPAQQPEKKAEAHQQEAQPPVNVEALEKTTVTQHDIKLHGGAVHYTATVGGIVISNEKGEPYHVMSYRAYTVDSGNATKRPVTFVYNGGPGSSSSTLNIGSFGPVRVVTKSPEPTGPPPYELIPNEYTLLDKTDLVFIDAPGTGFSHPVGKGTLQEIAGVDEDVEAFDRFIIRYIGLNDRWNSPRFLFGESYGTPRTAALVAVLQSHGIECNGVILLSSVLNYNWRAAGLDNIYFGYLPSYAAIAYYHHVAGQSAPNVAAWVQQAKEFALGDYVHALLEGNRLSEAETDQIAAKISHFTGLDVDYVKRSNLRIPPGRFRRELLRKEGLMVGRFDARFARPEADAVGDEADFDPTSTGMSGAYSAGWREYLQDDLKVPSEKFAAGARVIQIWDWKHRAISTAVDPHTVEYQPDTAADLGEAMRRNPSLKVYSANGYFDLATPFTQTEEAIASMPLSSKLRSNITFGYYPAGHMVYLNVDALKQFRADLEKFYDQALGQ